MRQLSVILLGACIVSSAQASDFSEGVYSCFGKDGDREGTATFKVSKVEVSPRTDSAMAVYYVDASFQTQSKDGKDGYGMKGMATLLTEDTGAQKLSIGSGYPTLSLSVDRDEAYSIVGMIKMLCQKTQK